MLHPGLLDGFFQFGYVTTDLDAAMAAYRDRFNVPEFLILDAAAMAPGSGSTLRVGLAWVGDTMVELIDPGGASYALYAEALPPSGIRLHHLGYRLYDEGRWLDILAELDRQSIPVLRMPPTAGMGLECCYADARGQLGHYLEFVWTKADQPDFFDNVPKAPRPGN
jgi:hypothetical protein